jgi:adenine deaminase
MMSETDSPDPSELQALADVALGKMEADLALVNGDIVNVYTGELLRGWSVATKGRRIAYVGPDASHTVGRATEVIDASGKVLIPGLVDAHTHIFQFFGIQEFLRYAMRGGTTTVISEFNTIIYSYGYECIIEALESVRDQPIKLFLTAPSMPTISPAAKARAMDVQMLRRLLARDQITGLGETYWSAVANGDRRLLSLIAETLSAGKPVEGHAAGARGRRLAAYAAAGASSCHESTTLAEAVERLRLGMHVMVREGEIREDLAAISKIVDSGTDLRRLILVTDGVGPRRLLNQGYLENVVQKAVDLGFDPIAAIRMATLNPAEHFGLESRIGGIAPGRYADIVVIPDLRTIKAECVVSNGRIIVRHGELLAEPRKTTITERKYPAIDLPRKLGAADFAVRVGVNGPVRVRVIDLVTALVTREVQLDMAAVDGEVSASVEEDTVKIALVVGTDNGPRSFVGLVRGFGMRKGALASTYCWDACGILVVGATEADMAAAVNRVVDLRGGIVVCCDERVQAELALPIGGLVSDLPMEALATALNEIDMRMADLGCGLPDPKLSLAVSTSQAIPFLRITEEGLVDVRSGQSVDLVVL